MTITAPIYETTLCGQRLRFFRSPTIDDNRPDFAWHSVDDLQRCLRMTAEEREFFLRSMREIDGKDGDPLRVIRTLATADGPVTVAPHYVAQAIIQARDHFGEAPEGAYDEYCFHSKKATDQLMGDLKGPAGFEWIIAAFHRWGKSAE